LNARNLLIIALYKDCYLVHNVYVSSCFVHKLRLSTYFTEKWRRRRRRWWWCQWWWSHVTSAFYRDCC